MEQLVVKKKAETPPKVRVALSLVNNANCLEHWIENCFEWSTRVRLAPVPTSKLASYLMEYTTSRAWFTVP